MAYSGNLYPYSNFYVYDYLFSKTKGNKYLFKTEFNEKRYRENLCNYEWTIKNIKTIILPAFLIKYLKLKTNL